MHGATMKFIEVQRDVYMGPTNITEWLRWRKLMHYRLCVLVWVRSCSDSHYRTTLVPSIHTQTFISHAHMPHVTNIRNIIKQLINQLATNSTDYGKKIKTKARTEKKIEEISANSVFIKNLSGTLYIRINILTNVRDATNAIYILLQCHSTCFGCRPHPSWGVRKTAVTATGTSHMFAQLPHSNMATFEWGSCTIAWLVLVALTTVLRKELTQNVW